MAYYPGCASVRWPRLVPAQEAVYSWTFRGAWPSELWVPRGQGWRVSPAFHYEEVLWGRGLSVALERAEGAASAAAAEQVRGGWNALYFCS